MSERELERLQALAQSGRYAEATQGLLDLRARDPGAIEAAALLAWISQRTGDAAACEGWLAAVFERDPDHRAALTIAIALALHRQAWGRALELARRFAALEPGHAFAHYNLGIALHRSGQDEAAAAAIAHALSLDPRFLDARLAGGWLALARGDTATAAAEFRQALAQAPQHPTAWANLGIAELRAFRGAAARAAFERATSYAPESASAWRGYSQACELEGDRAGAVAASARALALAPESPQELLDHAQCLARDGRGEEAMAAAARAAALAPQRLLPRWLGFQLMPHVLPDAAAIPHWRDHWRRGLEAVEALPLEDDAWRPQLADALTAVTNFHRHYLADDLRADQARYGALVTRMSRAAFPDAGIARRNAARARIRVGFASAHLRRHTIRKLFHGLLARLDREEFEVVALYLGPTVDDEVLALAGIADTVVGPLHNNEAWIAAIRAAELDALVWLDVGMDGLTQLLAPMRLAPLQCASWGHPVTTGLPAIDCFLSGAAMEPEGADAHYTERLVRLPGLGICYPLPPTRERPLPASGAGFFLCAQSVYKLLPEHDALFATLAARLPGVRLEFVPHPSAAVRASLAARMRPVFAGHGVDFDARVTLHPYLPEARFVERVGQALALLDTLHWSGGNTTLEALSCDVPVVTLPGAFMRGRHSHGMLEILGLAHELSARDTGHYIEIAARLAEDSGHRRDMSAAIRERKHLLFDDLAPVRALEDFLRRSCRTW